jgi:HEAT repeat protein
MATTLLLLLLVQATPQDRLAPLLERWRRGPEEERLKALRDAAALRPDVDAAGLARFADAPVPDAWTRPDDLIDLVAHEKIDAWYGLLVPLLSGRDPAPRAHALEELGRRDLARYAGAVVPALKDPDGRVAWQAAYALIQMHARDRVADLVPLLKDASGALRPNVLHALLRLSGREHAPLLEPFLKDPEPTVAVAVVQVLGQIGARESAPRVLRFLEAPEPAHRQAAIEALAAMGARDQAAKIAERLNDEMTLVRWEAVRALGRLGAKQYAGRIAEALEEDGGLAPGLEALGNLGVREQAPRIIPFLETPDPGIRWRAVRALGDIDADGEADRIAEMLKDPDSFVRISALQALAAVGSSRHAAAMLALLKDEDRDVCAAAAEEASVLAGPKEVQSVVLLLRDEDAFVRWTALRFLVGAGATDALPAIVGKLGDGPVLDRDVVWAIGRLGGKQYREKIAGALMNDDELVRIQAAFALGRLPGEAKELKAADGAAPGPTRLAAGFALVRQGRKSREETAALLREYLLHRDEPEYQPFADEVFDALATGSTPTMPVMLDAPVKIEKRADSVLDLLKQVDLADTQPDRKLQRRIPVGTTLSHRRAIEWSFGPDARVVPLKGAMVVMDTDRALEFWQKRLDAK